MKTIKTMFFACKITLDPLGIKLLCPLKLNIKPIIMRTQNKKGNVISKNINALIGRHLIFILLIFLNLPNSIGQKSEVETFHPKSTDRVQKNVNILLPFHQEAKAVSMEFVDGMAVIEGDIVLGPSSLYSGENQFAVVIDGDSYRWKNGIK